MKPHRIRMTHSLVMNYGLYKKMEIFVRCQRCPAGIVDLTHRPPSAGETGHAKGNGAVSY